MANKIFYYPAGATIGTIFEIPAGQTAEQAATAAGWGGSEWVELDEATFGVASFNYNRAFTLVDNQPSPNTATFDLSIAKTQAIGNAKDRTSTAQFAARDGYSTEVLATQASLTIGSRTPEIQAAIEAVNDLNTALQTDIGLVASATTIDEVDAVGNPPYGSISTYRTGQTLEASTYASFTSTSLTEADTELFIVGSSTVVSYSGGSFPSVPSGFNVGDYTIQIRQVSTSRVIAEFEVPEVATSIPFNTPPTLV